MDIMSAVFSAITAFTDGLSRNLFGVLIFVSVVGFLYLRFGTPKPRDMSIEVFNKTWEAAERLSFPSVKTLTLSMYPQDIEKLRNEPVYNINYQVLGEIVGYNCVGKITDLRHLIETQKFDIKKIEAAITEKLKDTVSVEEKAKIVMDKTSEKDKDKFWFIFAIKTRTTGPMGLPVFRSENKSLIYVRPNQVINMHSADDIIRIRGTGLSWVGQFLMIDDEFTKQTNAMLQMDHVHMMSQEVTSSVWTQIDTLLTSAMKLDTTFRKISGLGSLLPAPKSQEGIEK